MAQQLYYNPGLGVSTSNVCGYGNHLACTAGKEGCECPCGHPQDTVIEPAKEETTSDNFTFA